MTLSDISKESFSLDIGRGRSEELKELLDLITPKILNFIDEADPSSENYNRFSLNKYNEPEKLKQIFNDDTRLENGIKNDLGALSETMDKILKYSVNTWSPGFLDKLYATNNPIGVISDILLSVLNTNSHVYTVSPVLSIIENFISKKYAQCFFGLESESCGGLTFAGGSYSNITSMQIARSLKYPDTNEYGNGNHKFAVYASQHCHYSVLKSAILLGLGSSNVIKIDVNPDGSMSLDSLEQQIERSIANGYTPLYINTTAGTTVFGSFDPFQEISRVAKKYNCWFHVDGSWGGNVIFSEKQRHKLKGVEFADSITTNPHKMLGAPTTCSFLLLPDVKNFQKAMSLSAPYLFHGREHDVKENFDLADGTMGCGRRADALKLYMAWLYYGKTGFAKRIDHAFSITEYFVKSISRISNFHLIIGSAEKPPPCLQVCFYYRPDGYSQHDYTPITRYVSRVLHSQGRYLVDFSPNPSGTENNGEFFRVVFISPNLTTDIVDDLISSIIEISNTYRDQ